MLTTSIKLYIKKDAENNIPNECCGLIVFNNRKYSAIKCRNDAIDKMNYFIINPFDYIKVSDNNNIVGIYHSQEEKYPSDLDKLNCNETNLFSIIYSWKYKKFNLITPKLDNYLNREFSINKEDCFNLIIDYYKDKFNININNYYRNENWFKENPTIIFDNFANENFYEIDINNLKDHDILFFGKDKKHIGHMGIYIGNNLILHSQIGRGSSILYLSKYLKNKIIMAVRHKELI